MNQTSKQFAVLILLLVIYFSSSAQSYFQQEVNTIIHVTLDDRKHTLSAFEEIRYTNNSGSTLDKIYFHLYPNAYKDENTVLVKTNYNGGRTTFSRNDENGFIDSLNFKVDGLSAELTYLPDTIDVAVLKLPSPLLPGKSIVITTPFRVKIPSASISRLGHNGQAYYITQWFPKPAVYDKDGWKYMPYMDFGEFYSEFGSYDVYITLPANYIVGATGELQDNDELARLNEIDKETRAIKEFDKKLITPPSSVELKTLHYHQDNVHDFAWFADKRYHVLKNEITLSSGHRVTGWSYFTNAEANYWLKVPYYIERSLQNFSKWYGEYAYNTMSAVDVLNASGNGMEYPTIVTVGSYGDSLEVETTIAHEVAHNWFYGMLGSDERHNPWMDEGMTLFSELRYTANEYPNNEEAQRVGLGIYPFYYFKKINHTSGFGQCYHFYSLVARSNADLPTGLSSEKYNYRNYRANGYRKPALSFEHLRSYLGDALFDSCMHAYFAAWKFKHPAPADQQEVFEKVSGKKLNWFYQDILNSNRKADYAISSAKKLSNSLFAVDIRKKGDAQIPIQLTASSGESDTASIWFSSASDTTIQIAAENHPTFLLDKNHTSIDLYRSNNFYKTKGCFKKIRNLYGQLGTGIDDEEDRYIYFMPLIGGNAYNGVMAGLAIHNVSVFQKRFEYELLPMYAMNTDDLNGGGRLTYHIHPKNTFTQINISTGFSSYRTGDQYFESNLRFYKSDNKIDFIFKPTDGSKAIYNQITLRNLYIYKRIPKQYLRGKSVEMDFTEISFSRNNENPLERGFSKLTALFNKELFRADIELNRFFNYGNANKGFTARFFFGYTSISNSTSPTYDYRMRLSGRTGTQDYLLEEPFLGRAETDDSFYSRQFLVADAGFKAPTLFYRSADQWMSSLNFTTTLPGFIPFRLFYDIGTFNGAKTSYIGNTISWEAGIDLPIVKDIFTIYLPLLYSRDIEYVMDQENLKKSDLIRFELRLNKLNPLNLLRNSYKK